MPNIDLSILNQRATPAFFADTLANRPAPSFVGRIFISTDTYDLYRDTGSAWDLLSPSSTGTITGSGAAGQLALWNGTTQITGDSGLLYNATDNSITADKFVKAGGTSAQILAADGSNITAGTGISISGGTISSTATGITGTGVANQVAFWNGTSAITGENNLWWNAAANHFGINTNAPGTALDVHHNQETIAQFNQSVAGNGTYISLQQTGSAKWNFGNIGSTGEFFIEDAVGGLFPLVIENTTGQTFIGGASFSGSGKLVVTSSSSDNHLQVVGQNAPSIRINDFGVGGSNRVGIGISTATNNFIQGSAAGNMCIFNASLTASPILFGIYNGTNTQEAARISASRNLLVGQTADTGQTLQVTGSAAITGITQFSNTGAFVGFPGVTINQGSGTGIALSITKAGNNEGLYINKTSGTGNAATIIGNVGVTGTGTFSSSITASAFVATNGNNNTIVNSSSATTGWSQYAINNTSGSMVIGVESSVAGTTTTGSTAYATILRNYTNTDLQLATNNIVRQTITSTGFVGIGTTSPNTPLVVYGGHVSGQSVLKVQSGSSYASGGLSSIGFNDSNDTRRGLIYHNNDGLQFETTSSPIFFNPGGNEKARFFTTGNLLLGTSGVDNGQKLQVNGDVNATSFNSIRGLVSVAPATNTTFFTPSTSGLYIARVYLAGNTTSVWDAAIIFIYDVNDILVFSQINGTNVSTIVSGTNIQVRQIGGATYDFNYDIMKIR